MGKTQTQKTPVGDITITFYVQPSLEVAKDCTVYSIGDGECGESTLNCLYVPPAKLANKDLKDGTCAAQGYTQATGKTQTQSTPVGDITITFYVQPSLEVTQLDGTYGGNIPGIIRITVDFNASDSCNMDVSVIGQQDIKCTSEHIAETDSLVTFDKSANTGDCLGDSLRGISKDPSKYTLVK